jgi:hypothetical protein
MNPIIFVLVAACLYMGSGVIMQALKDAGTSSQSYGFEGEIAR